MFLTVHNSSSKNSFIFFDYIYFVNKNNPKDDCFYMCAAGVNRTPYASLFQELFGLSHLHSCCVATSVWSRALVQDYCWDSPASLYTFRGTNALPGSARDCSNYRSFPEFTQFFNLYFYRKPRRFRAALYQ